MDELFHPEHPAKIPEGVCEYCGRQFTTQVYELIQRRTNLTRVWRFCKLACSRDWAKNAR